MRALAARLTADSAVGAAGRAGVPPALPAHRSRKRLRAAVADGEAGGLLRRRPVYYSLMIGLNLVLLAGQPTRNRLLTQPPPVRGPPLNRAMQKTPCGPQPQVGAY